MRKFIFLLLWLPCMASAQRRSGYYADVLKDQNGVPVSGASIVIKGTRTGAITDKNGYFKIPVTEGDIISISYVGYVGNNIKITAAMLQAYTAVHQKQVEPVLSDDYAVLIHQKPAVFKTDFPDSIYNKVLQFIGRLDSYLPVKEVSIHNNKLQIYQSIRNRLTVSGNYNATAEIKSVNRAPPLQTQYVQGRPQNGILEWRGPETGESFSFGPLIKALAYDGSAYKYDKNGRLVPRVPGNGSGANVYDNSIFRTGFLHSQTLNVAGSLLTNSKQVLCFKMGLGQTDQRTIIRQNKNSNKNFSASIGTTIRQLSITGTYRYRMDHFTYSNQNGFLNRVYQNAMLTPISFDNAQGNYLVHEQRRYTSGADNPYFLLSNNGNAYRQSQHNAGLMLEKKQKKLSLSLIQSFESARQFTNEAYKPGSAYFENGISTQRRQSDKKYSLHANTTYSVPFSNYRIRSEASANYRFNTANTSIDYSSPNLSYYYQRSVHDASISNKFSYTNRHFSTGFDAANKIYLSATSTQKNFFLPSAALYVRFTNVLDVFTVKTSSSFNSFNTELPIHQSLAYTNLLQYAAQQSFQYFPVQEVSGYNGLRPVHHQEWNAGTELSYKNKLTFSAETFSRRTLNDIFPIYENGKLNLKNIATHQNKGIELQLSFNDYYAYHQQFKTQHSLSFFSYRSRVITVEDGYNYLPIAGFSNVHKALVKGKPLGVIMGNTYLRDANRNIIIGTDGFPLINNQPQVIGNSIPDFMMKLNNHIQWKRLTLNMDWEWSKGGDIWNGTQATLDYFGRSQNSATLRNTTGYVFSGVTQNGQKNGVPVSFLHLNEPVEANRWTRYGYSGVAEAYIQKAGHLKINSVTLAYKRQFKKYIQAVTLSAYINNILLWQAYTGADPNQALYGQPNGDGLDFFNLPSTKTIGFHTSIQF